MGQFFLRRFNFRKQLIRRSCELLRKINSASIQPDECGQHFRALCRLVTPISASHDSWHCGNLGNPSIIHQLNIDVRRRQSSFYFSFTVKLKPFSVIAHRHIPAVRHSATDVFEIVVGANQSIEHVDGDPSIEIPPHQQPDNRDCQDNFAGSESHRRFSSLNTSYSHDATPSIPGKFSKTDVYSSSPRNFASTL
jgi:hypothetical protein